MAALAQAVSGDLESEPVRVNGQPGRVVRGPAEGSLGAERLRFASEQHALLRSGQVDADELGALMKQARSGIEHDGELQVVSVLTVDVVDGRIQAVRIVRNPDKLAHL
jgi:RNA polymerase sigma-70 factor (ECF subfamily)